MAPIRVYEVATFYTMFQSEAGRPLPRCRSARTTPCWLRGSDELTKTCERKSASASRAARPTASSR